MSETTASPPAAGESAAQARGCQVLPDLTMSSADPGILSRLTEVAATLPAHCALDSGVDQLTYAQLERRVRDLAAELRLLPAQSADGDLGAAPPVAILAEQTPDSVAAVLAVL